MNDIYMLADTIIFNRTDGNLNATRLKQNITQQNLADVADISLSPLKKNRFATQNIKFPKPK